MVGSRLRRGLAVAAWVLAVLAFVGGAVTLVESLTFPRALGEHPIPTSAVVTGQFINGFGGDPGVDYRYRVNGRSYRGGDTGGRGHQHVADLDRGDPVAVDYARDDPSKSCTCDAKSQRPTVGGVAIDVACLVPLPWALLRRLRRKRSRSPDRASAAAS